MTQTGGSGDDTDGGVDVTGIDHLVLYSEDVEALCAFYADLLDAPVAEYGDGEGWLTVRFGTCQLNVRPADEDVEHFGPAPTVGGGDFCLVTETPIDDVVARLDEADVEIAIGPIEREGAGGTMTSVYFTDPDGNLAEMARYPT